MSPPRCPRCEGLDVETVSGREEASEGDLLTTHKCLNPKCHTPFKYTPPDREKEK